MSIFLIAADFFIVLLIVINFVVVLCLHYPKHCWLQITCKQESVLLFSDQKTVNSWIDALTKAIQ